VKHFSRPTPSAVDLNKRALYLTPSGRVCRLVEFGKSVSGQPLEATFVYENATQGSGPRELGERFTLRATVAQRTLRLLGEAPGRRA